MKELVDSLEKFDLDNYSLSMFFAEIAIDLDNLANNRELNRINYDNLSCASRILGDKSQEFRLKKGNRPEVLFFWKFYDREEEDMGTAQGVYANKLLILSEELSMVNNLPKEKIEELSDICIKLSKESRDYWDLKNPNGFKKY